MPARPDRRSFEAVQMSIDPSAVASANGWNVGFRNRAGASFLRWAVLIPTAALGFAAATVTSHSDSNAAPGGSFLGPSPTTSTRRGVADRSARADAGQDRGSRDRSKETRSRHSSVLAANTNKGERLAPPTFTPEAARSQHRHVARATPNRSRPRRPLLAERGTRRRGDGLERLRR